MFTPFYPLMRIVPSAQMNYLKIFVTHIKTGDLKCPLLAIAPQIYFIYWKLRM